MPIYYSGNQLVPCPLAAIQKQYVKNSLGINDHIEYTITLTGTIVNVGSALDSPSATTDGMQGTLGEQKRIRELFADGGLLEIIAPEGSSNSISCYCTVDSINFPQGIWYNRGEYSINLRSRSLVGDASSDSGLNSFSETWNVTENEDGTFSVNHGLTAQGALIYTGVSGVHNDPLSNARDWVQTRMVILDTNGGFASGTNETFNVNSLINSIGSGVWNKSTVEQVDPTNYTWNINENFIYYPSGNNREEWSASINYPENITTKANVTIAGTVFGYSNPASNQGARLNNAKTQFFAQTEPNLTTRLSPYVPGGFTLNPVPTTKQYSFEPPGNVRYSYNFLAAASGSLIANAIDENIEISDSGPTDVFASFTIPGRANGPYIQNISTKNSPTRSISINATLAPSGVTLVSLLSAYLAKPNTDAIVTALQPSAGYFYLQGDTEAWNPIRKQYSRNVQWIIDTLGSGINGMPNTIHNIP